MLKAWNGIAVGCYFYSYALTVEAVKKEAAFVIQQLAKYKGRILYPIPVARQTPP